MGIGVAFWSAVQETERVKLLNSEKVEEELDPDKDIVEVESSEEEEDEDEISDFEKEESASSDTHQPRVEISDEQQSQTSDIDVSSDLSDNETLQLQDKIKRFSFEVPDTKENSV